MALTKQDIVDSNDLALEKVLTPEWGGDALPVEERYVCIRTISARERDRWEQDMRDSRTGDLATNIENIRAALCALCIADENGIQLFADADVVTLGAKSAVPVDRIFWAAMGLNKLAPEDIEELAGNLPETPNDCSGSD